MLWRPLLWILALLVGWMPWAAPTAMAAEILSVRSATRLQVGDQNRAYQVELACLTVPEANRVAAQDWLRQHGARGSRVNLRPIGEHDGLLVARVSLLKTGLDLGASLVREGLAAPSPCPEAEGAG